MPPWLLDRRTLLAQMAAVLASPIAAFGQKRRIVGAEAGVPSPPIEAGSLKLGYSESEIPAIRTRLQTAAGSTGDKELFVSWLATLQTVFSGTITGTNYYSQDAGMYAMAAADLYMLDTEDASWAAAGINFPVSYPAIDTKAKCWDIADKLIRLSTYHDGQNRPGVTCLSRLQSGGGETNESEGFDTHIWSLQPTMLGVPVWYVWERIRAELDSVVSDAYVLAMVTWVDGNVPHMTSHAYPDVSASPSGNGQGSQGGNQATTLLSHLGMSGARVLLDTGAVTAEQEASIADAYTKCLNRFGAEYAGLWTFEGIGHGSFHEATAFGNGYAADNALAAARMALLLYPSAEFQTADFQRDWFSTLPESVMKGLLPGTNASTPLTMGYGYMMGLAEPYQQIGNSGEWLYLCAVAANRMGLTTQARQLKWLALNYAATTTISGSVAVPTSRNATVYRAAWTWYLVMGDGISGLVDLPMTAFTTRKGPIGTRIDNDMFDNPSRGTFYMFHPLTKDYGATRPGADEYAGSTQLWTRGSWVRLGHVGGNKGTFGSDCGTWFEATVSKFGYGKISSPAWTLAARGYIDGFPSTALDDSDVSMLSNASSYNRIGYLYADDPDHSTGFYAGYESLWSASVATRTQRMALSMNDKDLVVEFVRATPASGYYPAYVWASPVHLEYHNGTETIPDHYLLPGTPAKGAWLSDDSDTFVGVHSRAAFTPEHNGHTRPWPAADAKWFTTILSAAGSQDWRMEYRGYDATYVGAHRNNLEMQNGDSDYGRNAITAWVGIASAVGDGSTTIALTDNPPALPNTITRIYLSVGAGAVPIGRIGTYDHSANTFTVTSGGAVAAGTYNYSLNESRTEEMYFDKSGDREEMAAVMGDGTARILGLDDDPVEWCIVTKLGAASDSGFTAPPTYSKFTESDVWGVHIATDNVAVVVSRAHVSPTSTSDWKDGYDFLLPTTSTTQVHCCDLIPGVYGITRATEGGTNTRVTINPLTTGFTVGASGRIVVSVATGGVTLV